MPRSTLIARLAHATPLLLLAAAFAPPAFAASADLAAPEIVETVNVGGSADIDLGSDPAQNAEDGIARSLQFARITQTGDGNRARIDQTGFGNRATIVQTGNGGSAWIVQSGRGNVAYISQSGR